MRGGQGWVSRLPQRVERSAWPLFGAAAALASVLILWLGRDQNFTNDELVWVSDSLNLDFGSVFDPYNGHLIAVPRVIYKLILGTLGTGYLTFRLLTLAMVLVTATLVMVYASRRLGRAVALAPAVVLLVFGSDAGHLVTGNGFTVLLSISCGVGALLALERDRPLADAGACALLVLGVLTYSVALGFVAGAAVAVLCARPRRPARLWAAAVPAAVYSAWWLSAHLNGELSGQGSVINALNLPSWSFQSLSAALGALSGLDAASEYRSSDGLFAGPTLAVVAIVAATWLIAARRAPRGIWAPLAALVALWLLGAIAEGVWRTPVDTRYLYPTVVAVLLVAAWGLSGLRPNSMALLVLYAVAVVSLATNISQLRSGADVYELNVFQPMEAELGALEIAGDSAPDNVGLAGADLAFDLAAFLGNDPVGVYRQIADRFGTIGSSPDELAASSASDRALADRTVIAAEQIAPSPEPPITAPRCRPSASGQVPPGAVLRIDAGTSPADVSARRFGDSPQSLGSVLPDSSDWLALPADRGPSAPWTVTVSGDARVSTCASG